MFRVLEFGGAAAGYAGRLFMQAGCDVTRIDREAAADDIGMLRRLILGQPEWQCEGFPARITHDPRKSC